MTTGPDSGGALSLEIVTFGAATTEPEATANGVTIAPPTMKNVVNRPNGRGEEIDRRHDPAAVMSDKVIQAQATLMINSDQRITASRETSPETSPCRSSCRIDVHVAPSTGPTRARPERRSEAATSAAPTAEHHLPQRKRSRRAVLVMMDQLATTVAVRDTDTDRESIPTRCSRVVS